MKLTDQEIIEAYADTGSLRGAARLLGCSRATITKRIRDKELGGAIYERQKERVYEQTARLDSAAEKALGVLVELMNSEDERVRLRAADMILARAEAFERLSKMLRDDW